ncbi:MAG: serine/threonine protein kinase, partial [Hamadaea sp.]|nr:serine/threonine protein kinase [Hamadaea sp.]
MLTRGATIGDRYLLEEPLAPGGMSDVWTARDEVLHRRVALKAIAPRLLAEPGFAERFAGEARTLASLRHPGIVDVYDYGEADTTDGRIAYLVMELVDGESLAERLAAGPLDPGTTMGIVARAADALEAAHRAGVVHRDVKPANLLLTGDGGVVIVDFGVATSEGAAQLTEPGKVLGTAAYMAPEQAGKQPVTGAADVYALGAVAYHCLSGEPPFTGGDAIAVAVKHIREDPPPLPDRVPVAVREVVLRALAKDPAARYPSAAAL